MTDLRKTAVYIRLSAEDDNVDGRAKKESDSVTSQRILLKSFVIDQLGVDEADILEYVDDGVSGTHFKRQGFQQQCQKSPVERRKIYWCMGTLWIQEIRTGQTPAGS